MDKKVWIGACVAIPHAGATVAAQTSSSATSGQTSSDRPVTVTGCLQKGDQSSSSATTGTTGSASSAQFILANAKPSSGSSTAGTTGTAPGGATTESSRMGGNKYQLEGSATELEKHVGHQIEVTGTIDRNASGSTAGGAAAGAAGSASSRSGANPSLKVTSVKMVSSTCTSE